MASKEPAEENGAETEEETVAFHKKRSRRVSFAETTAIHLFIRDEEYETPPDGAANLSSEADGKLSRSESDEIMALLQTSSDDDSDGVGGEDDIGAVKSSFLRPMESPSPGSGFGSATSNDEDNFFGPVSMDFIKPGRLSGSAASEENHDVTMDSTAFSMHFRSLARSDSVGDSKTPTGIRLTFGERTPGQISTAYSVGDLMVLTTGRLPVSNSSFHCDKVNDSGQSDDMSLVSENPHRYDYGKLPPELDVLLADGGKDDGAASLNSHDSSLKKDTLYTPDQKRHELLDVGNADVAVVKGAEKTPVVVNSVADTDFYKKIGSVAIAPVSLVKSPSNKYDNLDDGPVTVLPMDNQGTPFDKDEKTRKILTESGGNLRSPSSRTLSNLDHEQLAGSSVAGSISSLLAKRRKILKVPVNSSNYEWNFIPLARELFDKESMKNVWSTLRFAKSVSRLKRLESFPFASTSKAEGTATRLIPSGCSLTSVGKDNLLGHGDSNDSINAVDAPVVCLEAHFSDVAKDNGVFKGKIGNNGLRSVGNKGHSVDTEGVKDLTSSLLIANLLSPERSRKDIKAMDFPSLTGYQKKELDHHMSNDNHTKVNQQSTGSDSSFPETTFNKYSRAVVMSDNSPFPSGTGSEKQVSASSLYLENLSVYQSQQGQFHSRLDKDGAPVEPGVKASRTETSTVLCSDIKHTTNVSSYVEHPKLGTQGRQSKNENPLLSNCSGLDPSLCCETVLNKASESFQFYSLDNDVQSRSLLTKTTQLAQSMNSDDGPTEGFERANELPIQVLDNSKEDPSFSLSRMEPRTVTDDAHMHVVQEDVPTPRSSQLTSKDDKWSKKQSYECGIDGSSGRKRKLEGFFDEAEQQLHTDQDHLGEGRKKSCNIRGDTKLIHWIDVLTSFCGSTKQLLSPLMDKHDLPLMEKLHDILGHLEKAKIYEHLCHSICYQQKTFDSANYLQNKRVMEVKSLLYRTVYKKAELQLLHLKRDKVLDQIQQLNSRVQESERLMSNFLCSSVHGHKGVQVDAMQTESCPIDIADRESGLIEISSLRTELEVSDRKINNLKESFLTYFKAVKEPSCSNITEYVKDCLKKRVSCRSMLSELQLCEIESLKAKDGQQDFLFNHHAFLSQRFSVNLNSKSISISKELNISKISKILLNMDACTAFSFVFGSETTHMFADLRTITQETQKTNSVLHNLLDVVEEVGLAVVELRNLTESRFSQLSAGKLYLQLQFRDFKSGARVNLDIDVTCLNRGVYPSHALPYETQGWATGKEESFQMLLNNIQTGLRGLRCGYMRIINLCRCVSKVMQVDNGMT